MNGHALVEQLKRYLDKLAIDGNNIGDMRRSLMMPFDCEWNDIVRDETIARAKLVTRDTPAGPVLTRVMDDKEEASTGAVRSSLYPKGAQFPARYDLMWRNAAGMRRLAETWGEGFAKYGADNWLKGFAESVLISHSLEHIRLYLAGDRSEDHLAHCAWNVLALAWIEENKPELLDLTKPEQKP